MPNRGDDETLGIWISEDESIKEDFDEYFGKKEAHYSRSKRVKAAMRLYLTVQQTYDRFGYNFSNEVSIRHHVRQALLDIARSEGVDTESDTTNDTPRQY